MDKPRVVVLEELLRSIYQKVTNGRLCYFGTHTGYEPQFSTSETERWAAVLATSEVSPISILCAVEQNEVVCAHPGCTGPYNCKERGLDLV